MAFIVKWAHSLARRALLVPLNFPGSGFPIVRNPALLEEEHLDEFKGHQYYPVEIGDVIASTYQVVGKLGFGSTSTVWLALNLVNHDHVALKVYTRHSGNKDEFQILERIAKANPSHPGYRNVRSALDIFQIQRPGGAHFCLVQRPMWESWKHSLRRNPSRRFSEPLLKAGLRHLFMALDYLHSECRLVHTDIKADNILQDIKDQSILESFVKAEMTSPSPRKSVGGMTVYASRTFNLPRRFGEPVLSDFGAAVNGDLKRNHDAQPAVYRSPEVMLETPWSYPIDIWNVGVMIWDLFLGKHIFYGEDPNGEDYTTRAHLAEVIALLGPPPLDLLRKGVRTPEFFAKDGKWIADIPLPATRQLEDCDVVLESGDKKGFFNLMRSMLQWRPEDRKTARELARDPWINS